MLTDDEIKADAHRMAWRYKKSSDPHHSDTYTFNDATLAQFARAIERKVVERCADKAQEIEDILRPEAKVTAAAAIRAMLEDNNGNP